MYDYNIWFYYNENSLGFNRQSKYQNIVLFDLDVHVS